MALKHCQWNEEYFLSIGVKVTNYKLSVAWLSLAVNPIRIDIISSAISYSWEVCYGLI